MWFKNSTTFAKSLGSTQGLLVRVEVLVLFSALIWILVELFGSRRRRQSHGFFRFFVWAVYTLFTVLVPYTIGLLQNGTFRDQTFVLWGALLLFIQVSADSLSVYSIHDIEQRKRMLVQHMLQIILVLWLIVNCKGHNRSYTATIWIIWVFSIILTYRKSGTLSNASRKGGLLKESKVIADYMMIEHEHIPQDVTPDPQTMEGYRYIFHGEEELVSLLPTGPVCARKQPASSVHGLMDSRQHEPNASLMAPPLNLLAPGGLGSVCGTLASRRSVGRGGGGGLCRTPAGRKKRRPQRQRCMVNLEIGR